MKKQPNKKEISRIMKDLNTKRNKKLSAKRRHEIALKAGLANKARLKRLGKLSTV